MSKFRIKVDVMCSYSSHCHATMFYYEVRFKVVDGAVDILVQLINWCSCGIAFIPTMRDNAILTCKLDCVHCESVVLMFDAAVEDKSTRITYLQLCCLFEEHWLQLRHSVVSANVFSIYVVQQTRRQREVPREQKFICTWMGYFVKQQTCRVKMCWVIETSLTLISATTRNVNELMFAIWVFTNKSSKNETII